MLLVSVLGIHPSFANGTSQSISRFAIITPAKSFVLVKGEHSAEAEKALKAVENADMEMFRLRNSRRTLTFQGGVVIELLSAEELRKAGFDIDPSHYTESLPKGYKEPTYVVSTDGKLIQYFETLPTKH